MRTADMKLSEADDIADEDAAEAEEELFHFEAALEELDFSAEYTLAITGYVSQGGNGYKCFEETPIADAILRDEETGYAMSFMVRNFFWGVELVNKLKLLEASLLHDEDPDASRMSLQSLAKTKSGRKKSKAVKVKKPDKEAVKKMIHSEIHKYHIAPIKGRQASVFLAEGCVDDEMAMRPIHTIAPADGSKDGLLAPLEDGKEGGIALSPATVTTPFGTMIAGFIFKEDYVVNASGEEIATGTMKKVEVEASSDGDVVDAAATEADDGDAMAELIDTVLLVKKDDKEKKKKIKKSKSSAAEAAGVKDCEDEEEEELHTDESYDSATDEHGGDDVGPALLTVAPPTNENRVMTLEDYELFMMKCMFFNRFLFVFYKVTGCF